MKIKTPEDLYMIKNEGLKALYPGKTKITVGTSTCGLATGAGKVLESLVDEVQKNDMDILIERVGCLGFCQKEPIVTVLEPGKPKIIYEQITPEKVVELIAVLKRGEIKKDWVLCKMEEEECLVDGVTKKFCNEEGLKGVEDICLYQEVDFYRKQLKIALNNCGFIDPERIEEYIARGGYFPLYKVLHEMSPQEVIEEVKQSGLRGRGGAGFPTGVKWESCRNAKGDIKYVICNADEGDPGAYMDRSILEGDPYSVLEGMVIGAYAIGAHEGYIYLRNEYPLAIRTIKKSIEKAEGCGLLGENILNSNFDFTVKINRGGGAFVCGESSALMASLEGKVGEPRAKYIRSVEKGLWDRPSNINNVETWANVPVIIARGAEWFAKIGTKSSRGTKVFSVVGKVNNTGLVEVPMGISLKEIIYDICGGVQGNKKFKAVQTGGPSGGCIPESLIHLPVDYEELARVGSMMGSGGMIVMDEDTCMVDIANYFLTFLEEESCGKCVPCREGIKRARQVLQGITEGRGEEGDIELLQDLGAILRDGSLCGLGTSAANPVLSTLRYFREEYETHIRNKKCPAGVCRELFQYFIDPERCEGCHRCVGVCPQQAVSGEKRQPHSMDQSKCIKCGACVEVCKFGAIVKQ